jgi:hypothetical protein
MPLTAFLEKIARQEPVSFTDTIAVITEHYDYQPTMFSNGLGDDALVSAAGTNEGSCKIFAFAKLNGLDTETTLNLFGDYYRLDVLNDPQGNGHQNIRNFMKYGWEGVSYQGTALVAKPV